MVLLDFLPKRLVTKRRLAIPLLIGMTLLALMAAASSSSVRAADLNGAAADKSGRWNLNLKDVDIRAFLEQVSTITGENFVVDSQVKGKVTVIASTPMDMDSVDELILTVLRVNGLAAVPNGSITRIVPQVAGRPDIGGTSNSGAGGQKIVTRVIPVRNANMEEVVKILKPLVSSSGYLEGSAFSNAVIVADYADSVGQIVKALEGLDAPDSASVETIALKDAWVGNIAPMVEALLPMQLGEAGKGRNRLRIIVDENNNSLLVRGSPRERAEVRKLVLSLDKPGPKGSDIQMISLRYADAKDVARLLNNIVFPSNKHDNALSSATLGNIPPPSPAVLSGLLSVASSSLGQNAKQAGGSDEEQQSGHGFVQADVSLNALVIHAEPSVISEVRALVKQLDVMHPQVLIEAAVVEITSDQTQQIGIQLAGGAAAQSIYGGTTQFSSNELALSSVLSQLGGGVTGIGEGLSVAIGAKQKFTALVQALAGISGANLLSTPSIMTLDNEEAKIVVGQTVPFVTGSTQTLGGGVAAPFTTIDREDVGITLKVVPQIHEGNIVQLKIEQEVSSVATNSGIVGAADLITNKRSITTKVMAEDGQTIVLGGLMEDDLSESENHVPILGDIPILGLLFSNDQKTSAKRDLLVFLRPTVISTHQQMGDMVQSRFGHMYELQFGKLSPDLVGRAEHSDHPQPMPDAETIFNPPSKEMSSPFERIR